MKHQAIEILTKKGRIYTYLKDKLPEAMQNCQVLREFEIEIPDERPKIEVDTPLWVWDNSYTYKKLRCFSHFSSKGNICCYDDGLTSQSTGSGKTWQNYELVIKDK